MNSEVAKEDRTKDYEGPLGSISLFMTTIGMMVVAVGIGGLLLASSKKIFLIVSLCGGGITILFGLLLVAALFRVAKEMSD